MRLRKATLEDAKLLFEFRNEEETRKNSKHQEPVLWESHIRWLTDQIAEEASSIYIAEVNEKPIGQIRLFIEEQIALISYSVDKSERNKGYGTQLLCEIEELACKDNRILALEGEVKENNPSSGKCFEKVGYTRIKQEAGMLLYHKKLEKRI